MNELLNGTQCPAKTQELVERIEASVRHRLGGWILDFKVQIQDRGLVLRGRTRTYYAKQLVQDTAMKVGGLPILANRVEVS